MEKINVDLTVKVYWLSCTNVVVSLWMVSIRSHNLLLIQVFVLNIYLKQNLMGYILPSGWRCRI